jgi:hypothetical protein
MDFAAGVCLSNAPSPPMNPHPSPPLSTVYMYTTYMYIFTQGKGAGRVEPETRLEGKVQKAGHTVSPV